MEKSLTTIKCTAEREKNVDLYLSLNQFKYTLVDKEVSYHFHLYVLWIVSLAS